MWLEKSIRGWFCVTLALALLAGCASTKRISTQQQDLDNLQREIQFLKEQNAKYQRELDNLSARLDEAQRKSREEKADLAAQIEDLTQQLDAVRGLYKDTNYRITALSQGAPAVESPETDAPQGAGGVDSAAGANGNRAAISEDSRELYNTAYRDLIRGNYQLALHGFRQFMQQYPNTDLSDNAQYWIGEVFYAQGRFSDAIQEFEKVLKWYRDGDKTPSALLKIGYAYINIDEQEQGRLYLEEVIRDHPDSDEANLARGRLAALE